MSERATFETRSVLFDLDGTLIDTTYLHTVAWWHAFRQVGLAVSMHRIHRSVGMGSDHLIDAVVDEEHTDEQDDAVRSAHASIYAMNWPVLQPFPGAQDLVRRLHGDGLTVVLASSAGSADLSAAREVLQLDDCFTAMTHKADVERSKPEPDLLEAALEQSGLRAEDAVFVGDAVWDVEAANRLDIPSIGLACGGYSADELRTAGAVDVYDDPADLLEHYPFVVRS